MAQDGVAPSWTAPIQDRIAATTGIAEGATRAAAARSVRARNIVGLVFDDYAHPVNTPDLLANVRLDAMVVARPTVVEIGVDIDAGIAALGVALVAGEAAYAGGAGGGAVRRRRARVVARAAVVHVVADNGFATVG
jgi:hypothetical protein